MTKPSRLVQNLQTLKETIKPKRLYKSQKEQGIVRKEIIYDESDYKADMRKTFSSINYNRKFYQMYLKSKEWQAKRKMAFDKYGRKCSRCGGSKELQVHHKTYVHIFREKVEELEVVCKCCHEKIHKKSF